MKTGLLIAAASATVLLGNLAFASTQGGSVENTVNSGLSKAAMPRVMVSEYFMANGKWPERVEDIGQVADGAGPAALTLGEGGVITITYSAPQAIAGGTVTLTPSATGGAINWACKSSGIPEDALPVHCR